MATKRTGAMSNPNVGFWGNADLVMEPASNDYPQRCTISKRLNFLPSGHECPHWSAATRMDS
jgi:hypothetical protein